MLYKKTPSFSYAGIYKRSLPYLLKVTNHVKFKKKKKIFNFGLKVLRTLSVKGNCAKLEVFMSLTHLTWGVVYFGGKTLA